MRDRFMAGFAATGIVSLLGGAFALGLSGPAQAEDVPCGTPAKEAVYQTVRHDAVPAVTEQRLVTPAVAAWTETKVVVPAWSEEVLVTPEVPTTLWRYQHVVTGNFLERGTPDWNAQSNNESTGWVMVGPANGSPAVYETVTHPAVTEDVFHEAVAAVYETIELSPARPAWTEEKLVSPAVPAGPPCSDGEEPATPPVVDPVEEADVCTNIPGAQAEVPKGYSVSGALCTKDAANGDTDDPKPAKPIEVQGEEGEKPRVAPVVAGRPEAVPTVVDAGFGPVAAASQESLLGQGLVGGGLVLLLLAGSMQMGRRERGAHEA